LRLPKFYLEIRREDAGWCSRATNEILKCHVHFADLMAQRIEGASKSWLRGFRSDDSEKTSRLANDINKASRSLSEHVADMQKNLSSFVSILEKVQVTAREQQSLVGRILGWLKSLFKAIVKVFVTLGTLIFLSRFIPLRQVRVGHHLLPPLSGRRPPHFAERLQVRS